MLENNVIIKVTNRDNGRVGYHIPELNNLRRVFAPKETKDIMMEELRKLIYQPGGRYLLANCLILNNHEAINELLGNVQPEYFYDDNSIIKLLTQAPIERFLDCLDFAPVGVIEQVKKYAVELEINDISKRKAIMDKTGFNVTKAIEINHETDEKVVENSAPKRRVATTEPTQAQAPKKSRRTEAPKYEVKLDE